MKPTSRGILIGAAAFLVFAGAGFYFVLSRQSGDEDSAYDVRAAPDFSFKDTEGRDVRLRDFRGTPLLVYVWASWCARCPEGLHALGSLQKEFGGAVAVVAINRAESSETVARFRTLSGSNETQGRGIMGTSSMLSTPLEIGSLTGSTSRNIGSGTAFLLDPEDAYYRAIGGFAMPEILFVDRDGTIRSHKRGPMEREEFRRRVEDLVAS